MEKKLKIGLVGCDGIMKWAHIPAFAHMDNVEIVAMCDIVPGRCEEIKTFCREQYKSDVLDKAVCYTDYEEMLKNPDVEAVDICAPNYLHCPFSVKAFEAGKHVFCEKPDSVSVEGIEQMKAAAEKAGKVLMVMRNNRYHAYTKALKARADAGEFGQIYCGRCGWVRRRGIPGKGGWFTTKEMSGGGPLIDLGVHMIDLAIYLMGNPRPVSVTGAVYSNFGDNDAQATSVNAAFGEAKRNGIFDVEDQAIGLIRFENGASLIVDFSWAANIEAVDANYVELRGTKAGLKWKNSGAKAKIFKEVDGEQITEDIVADTTIGGHEANLRHFADVVLNGEKPDYTPQQGIDMLKILCAIYESARTGREVRL